MTAAYIICKLKPENITDHIPDYVSILKRPDQLTQKHKYPGSPNNLHPVTKVKDTGSRRYNYTVCVRPLYNVNGMKTIGEFVEVNRLFGADHFVFYNLSASFTSSDSYLEYYVNKSILSIYQWNMPKDILGAIHSEGQLAAINDCVYKNMFISKYVVIIDLDELIVPMKTASWSELTWNVDRQKSKCYIFQCVFFRTAWPSDTTFLNNSIVKQYNIQTLLKTHREREIWPHMSRSKMILAPEYVNVSGIHFVHSFSTLGISAKHVPASDAMMFHYRKNLGKPNDPLQLKETRMHDFAEDVMKRIKRVHRDVKTGDVMEK